jgi:succinoglycan biosynthesis protein ExoA
MFRISIIVPCRNEGKHIRSFVEAVLAQVLPPETELEMLIADGMSVDGTRTILDEYAASHAWIHVLDNPEGGVSTGLNRAILRASGSIIIRMDVHAHYAEDYVEQCVAVLRETGADNVGGPARTKSEGYMQEAISAAYNSAFSCGGARFHNVNYEGPVDTVTFGCWRREAFDKMGLFDEGLIRNQDDELNLRLVKLGGTIYQSPRIRCWYEPRSSLGALFSQYRQYGYWKVRVIEKHGAPASLRHLVPATFVAALAVLAVGSLFSSIAFVALLSVAGLYALVNLAASVHICRWKRLHLLAVVPIVLATYHVSYGFGFLVGVLHSFAVRDQKPSQANPDYPTQ